jgi:DnaK suppressor protein
MEGSRRQVGQQLHRCGARSVDSGMFSLAQAYLRLDDQGNLSDAKLIRRFESTIVSFMDLVEASKLARGSRKPGTRLSSSTTRVSPRIAPLLVIEERCNPRSVHETRSLSVDKRGPARDRLLREHDMVHKAGNMTHDSPVDGSVSMDEQRARQLISRERSEVMRLLDDAAEAQRLDHAEEREVGNAADAAQALTSEGVDDAFVVDLHERLASLGRAEARLDHGTYGRSIRSGLPIGDERLEADPAAELTEEEAAAEE